jgi:hypothetical protein
VRFAHRLYFLCKHSARIKPGNYTALNYTNGKPWSRKTTQTEKAYPPQHHAFLYVPFGGH